MTVASGASAETPTVDDASWRPLGDDTEDAIAVYDALHDGVPAWMETAVWEWIGGQLVAYATGLAPQSRGAPSKRTDGYLREQDMSRRAMDLRISIPYGGFQGSGESQIAHAVSHLRASGVSPLKIADYMLAHFRGVKAAALEECLERCKSAWRVGTRSGRPGLERRVPIGVQEGADQVMSRAGRAGSRLAQAWQELYGQNANPSAAYRSAIIAVEDAAIPIVSPTNKAASLGTVLKQMEDQTDWRLPMEREHTRAPSSDVLIGMTRLLWHGQHDRHGGQPTAPGNVTHAEATVAVGIATTLVHWFDAGVITRAGAA